jgi:hypothetical protein
MRQPKGTIVIRTLALTVGLRLTLIAPCVCCPATAVARGEPAAPITPDSSTAGNGAILTRTPCNIDIGPTGLSAVMDFIRADILKANLAGELAARPLSSIFTDADNERLASATATGRCERVIYRSSGLNVVGFVLRPATNGPHPARYPGMARSRFWEVGEVYLDGSRGTLERSRGATDRS